MSAVGRTRFASFRVGSSGAVLNFLNSPGSVLERKTEYSGQLGRCFRHQLQQPGLPRSGQLGDSPGQP